MSAHAGDELQSTGCVADHPQCPDTHLLSEGGWRRREEEGGRRGGGEEERREGGGREEEWRRKGRGGKSYAQQASVVLQVNVYISVWDVYLLSKSIFSSSVHVLSHL